MSVVETGIIFGRKKEARTSSEGSSLGMFCEVIEVTAGMESNFPSGGAYIWRCA